ncbi:MAG: PPC domain-containing protein [Planctomycetaceae bacterium]|nr:PPC domain-containing protein [Planctomycetaceae bacterium]
MRTVQIARLESHSFPITILFTWMAAIVATSAPLTLAQPSSFYPMVMSLDPVAIQVGTTSEMTVESRYSLAGTHLVFVTGEGVTGEPILPEETAEQAKKDLTSLKIRFTATSDALPGVREFRLITPQGASTVGQLVVTLDPVIVEQKDNDTAEKAQVITLPATVCGAIEKNEDFDFYRFTAKAGDQLTFHVRGQRLQDKIHDLQTHADLILFLRDAGGGVLAMSDNALFADPLLNYQFTADGDYTLELRDVRFQGNKYWQYALEISPRPFVATVHPLAVAPGATATLAAAGENLPQGSVANVVVPEGASGSFEGVTTVGDAPVIPAPVYATTRRVVVEPETPNNEIATAVDLGELPVTVAGRIESENDLDCYRFTAKKGEAFSFEIVARRLSSDLDSYLRFLDANGKVQRETDDITIHTELTSDSWLENWVAPADGDYFVEVRDVHLRGGPRFTYVLNVDRATPYFQLVMDDAKTQLTPGSSNVMFIRALKKNGFDAEIELLIDNLPPGIEAVTGRILKGATDGAIVLTAPADAPLQAANVVVRGVSTFTPKEGESPVTLEAAAVPFQEIYLPGGGRGHWPIATHTVCVGNPSDILKVTLSEYDIHLKPGEFKDIDVTIERAPGMTSNVTLDMVFQHLARPFANSLPQGVSIDGSASNVLLTGANTAGKIRLKAEKTAPPVEKQVCAVMAHLAINFVMKSTYSSTPVWVTVQPAE